MSNQRLRANIRPGGMLADIVENELGADQHLEVKNWKEVKVGEWQIIKGYINAKTGFTDVKRIAEVTDDLSGDRFLILQDGADIKRLDYDITGSPITGYENETALTLTIPTGVTVTANDDLQFFVHNGVVRITGGTEPIWYGYVQRKLLYTGYVEVDKFFFEAGSQEANFTGVDATVAADATWGGKQSTNSMKITVTSAGGYAYRQITAKTKSKFRLFFQASKNDAGATTEDWFVYVGTSPGAGDIKKTQHQAFNKVSTTYCIFEFDVPNDWDNPTTTIYISIYPQTDFGTGDSLNVDHWLLHESYPQVTLQDWFLEKAALKKYEITDVVVNNAWSTDEQGSDSYNTYCKVAAVYDGGQYSLMDVPAVISNVVNSPTYKLLDSHPKPGIKINLFLDQDPIKNKRLTGALIILGTVLDPLQETDPSMVWKVNEYLDFTEHPPDIEFSHDHVKYDTTNPNTLELSDTGAGVDYHTHWEDGYFQVGAYVHLRRGGIQWISKITSVDIFDGVVDSIDLEDAIWPYFFTGVNPDANFDETDMWIKISRTYLSVTNGYETNIGVEVNAGDVFWDFASIPNGTIKNTPDYTHHLVVENIGFILSNEEAEQDIIRYSPVNQPDNFPVSQVITTPIGDIDRNLALVERDGRFVTLKRKSVAQGQFTSNSYYHDKDGVSHGLYATYGYIVIDDVLYFMDIDDIYLFNGVQVLPFMQNSLMRSYYVENVNTSSFFAYKPLDKELWIVLNGVIIVFDFERKKFYLRETDLSPLYAITDYDQRLIAGNATKMSLFDHSASVYAESISAYFKTGLKDLKDPEHWKQLHKIYARLKCNKTITVKFSDPLLARYYEELALPNADTVDLSRLKPNYIFKEGQLEITVTSGTDLYGTAKSFDLIIQRWGREP